jgi:queuine tRNA-ribosyltransferase
MVKNNKIFKDKGVKTPFFMPDATRGAVKLLSGPELGQVGIRALVVNTLHLYLQPGTGIVKKVGGMHKFMDWEGLLLSDSGGFQVFSLIHKADNMGRIEESGAVFRSPLDGSVHKLTPEKSIQIQFDLGVDAMVCLDDCPPNDTGRDDMRASIERTLRWAKRCKEEHEKQIKKRKLSTAPLLFAVIQGGIFPDMREWCARELADIGFDGYGFGARHVDDKGVFLDEVLERTARAIPDDAFKFALGVGLPEDIVRCARMGWEMFDCVIPSREARHGKLFQKKASYKYPKETADFYKVINISNSKYKNDSSPVNTASKIPELRNYSKAYIRHLFRTREPLGARLATLNNLEFYNDLVLSLGD